MSQLTGKHVEPDPAEQAVLNEIGHLARANLQLSNQL
jgi:hypothetical protein